MELSIKAEKIAGTPSDEYSSDVLNRQVHFIDGSNARIVSCVSVWEKEGKGQEIVRDIFELTINKLEDVNPVDGMLKSLTNVLKGAEEYAGERGIEVNLAHILFYKNVAFIVRLGEKIKILVFDPPKQMEVSFASGSGRIKPGQLYLISTEKFLSIMDTGEFKKEKDFELRDIIDGLATDISAAEDQDRIAAGFVQITGEGRAVEEESGVNIVKEEIKDEEIRPVNSREYEPQEGSGESIASKVSAFFSSFFGKVASEVRLLKRGDISAIFRMRRNVVLIGVVALLILAISAGVTLNNKRNQDRLVQFEGYIATAESKLEEGSSLISLNRERSRSILLEADEAIKLAMEIDEENEEVKKLAAEITQKLGETEVLSNVDFETFYESGEPVNSIFYSDSLIAFTNGAILSFDSLGDATDLELSGGDTGVVYDGSAFILGSEVARIDLKSGEEEKVADAGGVLDISVFNGNVYLLKKDGVTKVTPIEGGYSEGSEYLSESASFSDSANIAIDGFVYVASDKKIYKYLVGESESLEISGLAGEVGELTLIYTSADLDNIYVVDRQNSALLILDKDGVYQRALQSGEFARANDIAVSGDETEIYVASGQKILRAPL